MSRFRLRCPGTDLPALAPRYSYPLLAEEQAILRQVVPAARARGWLTKADLVRLAVWKTPRSKVARNGEEFVVVCWTLDKALRQFSKEGQ
jgi:hypothetical protein